MIGVKRSTETEGALCRTQGNSKLQFPNHKQITNSKFIITNGDSSFEYFGLWILGIVWNLVLGYWDFLAFYARRGRRVFASAVKPKG